MKPTVLLTLLLLATATSCTHSPKCPVSVLNADTTTTSRPPADQQAGLLIIDTLSKLWGDAPNVVGDFIGKPRCPSYLEGMYFDGATLVFQVRGDTLQARQELEQAAGSTAFRLEQATGTAYSQKTLDSIADLLHERYRAAMSHLLVRGNLSGFGTGVHRVYVSLVLNTPERRRAFRQQVMDSPALYFTGDDGHTPCLLRGTNDTLGISLTPEQPCFSTDSQHATFVLRNHSNATLTCGERYTLARQEDGQWYVMPVGGTAHDIAYLVHPGGERQLTARLRPDLYGGNPGRYRFFTQVESGGVKLTLAADFSLCP